MNKDHKSRLLAAFQHVDSLLREAEHIMGGPESLPLIEEYSSDTTLAHRERLHDHVMRVQNVMRGAVGELQVPLKPAVSAYSATRSRISAALVAVAEIEPRRLRGYGALTEEDEIAVHRIVDELKVELRSIDDYLGQ